MSSSSSAYKTAIKQLMTRIQTNSNDTNSINQLNTIIEQFLQSYRLNGLFSECLQFLVQIVKQLIDLYPTINDFRPLIIQWLKFKRDVEKKNKEFFDLKIKLRSFLDVALPSTFNRTSSKAKDFLLCELYEYRNANIKSTQMIDERRAIVCSLYEQFFGDGSDHFLCARILLEQIKLDLASGNTLDIDESNNLANHLRKCLPTSDDTHGIVQRLWLYTEYYLIKFQVYYSKLTNDMSKKIKQDYEEQKRQAAENNSINQIETFHAESMTMEAHKMLGKFSEKSIMSTLFKSWDMIKSKSTSLCTIETLKRVASIYPNEIDMFYSNLHTIAALFDLFQHYTEAMEIYRYLLDLLPAYHPSRLTIITACNRLANKCSINLEDRYKPVPNLSSRDYPKATTQISSFDVDEALNLITIAENFLHNKNVSSCKQTLEILEKRPIVSCSYADSFFVRSHLYNLQSKLVLNDDEQLKDFSRNDFLALIEESRSYCAQDLRTSLDIVDVNRLPELSQLQLTPLVLHALQAYLSQVAHLILLNFEIGLYRNAKNYLLVGLEISVYLHAKRWFTFFLALNAQFFILSHQPDCARRKLDQLSHHLSTLDICNDRKQDLFIDFIYSWYDYVKLEYDYHTHGYDHIQTVCETKLYHEYKQHNLSLDWHRLLFHRIHILYRLTYFQQLRKNSKSMENRKRLIWNIPSNSEKYTEFTFWTESWLSFLSLIEDQPPEILDKSSLWLHPIIVPDESNLTCLPEWTAMNDDQHPYQQQTDSKWNNILSPPQVNTGNPFDLNSMTTEEIVSLTNEPIVIKTKPKKLIDTPRGKTPFLSENQKILSTPNKPSSSTTTASNLMSTFRKQMSIDSSIASPVCTPSRTGKKLPPLVVASSNTSSRPRRAAAIKADERIQQIRYDDTNENLHRINNNNNNNIISPRILATNLNENNSEPVELLIDQLDSLHIERKLKFDDEDEEEINPSIKSNEKLLQKCIQLHDRLAYAPNAKLIRYLAEYIILLAGDQDPWLVVTLIVEMQAIGFRYNALCIYQRKKRHNTDRSSTPLPSGSNVSPEHLSHYIDALHFRPLTIAYLKDILINDLLPAKQVCVCLHSFTLIDDQILAVQIRGNYYAPVMRRIIFPRLLVKKFHFLIESNTHTLHGITDHKRYWAIRRYFEQLFERLLEDLNYVYLTSPMRWWWLPETSIFDGKKAMIDDLLTPLTNSPQQRRSIEFFLHQTIFYLSSLDEIRQELSINLPSTIYSHILSSRLIERLLDYKQRTYTNTSPSKSRPPQNLLLFLDNHLHIFPWEQLHCMTSLFRRIVIYRLPSVLLLDGMHKYYYNSSSSPSEQQSNVDNNDTTIIPMEKTFYHRIDVDKGYYIVDPGNDLPRTKERFRKFQTDKPDLIEKWNGVIERFPTNDAIKDIFKSKDVLLYMGHGSGSQFYPVDDVQKNSSRLCVLLMGCSSARLQSLGDFEVFGMPFAYLTCGAATILGCLWDVTDRDIDSLTFFLLEQLKAGASLGEALRYGRDLCKLKCLNGAAPVIYGLPVRAR
ncbi:unnamed protein product [Adineta steineri]|uniref:separase n=1 Tax=Adineta steineri TaxID=433720 RepID=A0A814UMS4_9BILA|nr:unnamed protein product [Adineta steineri]CAF1240497.1 unnamed protein product [Adineta steineri]